MNERISALMDGELDDTEMIRDLGRLRANPDLRRSWDTYHLIGDILRDHGTPGLAARVSRRLAAEPVVLAPVRHAAARRAVQIGLSVAAGAAGITLVAWMALPALLPEQQEAAVVPAVAPAAVAVAPPAAVGVENYLLAHQSFSPAGAMQGMAPYVRTVSDQPKDGRK